MDTLECEEDAKTESQITQVEMDLTDEERQDSKPIMSNKVDEPDFSKATSKDPTNSVAITKTWRVFVESSTLHGLQYVFTSRTLVRRILWSLSLVAAILWFSFQSSKLLRKYFSYPAATKVSLVHEDSPEFPAVSICNFNQFRKSVIMEKGYDDPLRQFERKAFGLNTENFTTDFSKYRHFNFTEFSLSAGHQINDTLRACVWSGITCDYRNFTPILTSMGLCHTFNSGRSASCNFRDINALYCSALEYCSTIERTVLFSVRNYMNHISDTFLYWLIVAQREVKTYTVLCFVHYN